MSRLVWLQISNLPPTTSESAGRSHYWKLRIFNVKETAIQTQLHTRRTQPLMQQHTTEPRRELTQNLAAVEAADEEKGQPPTHLEEEGPSTLKRTAEATRRWAPRSGTLNAHGRAPVSSSSGNARPPDSHATPEPPPCLQLHCTRAEHASPHSITQSQHRRGERRRRDDKGKGEGNTHRGRPSLPPRRPPRRHRDSHDLQICEEQNLPANRRCHRRNRKPNHRSFRGTADKRSHLQDAASSTAKGEEGWPTYFSGTAPNSSPRRRHRAPS